jgi:hypothetical protein
MFDSFLEEPHILAIYQKIVRMWFLVVYTSFPHNIYIYVKLESTHGMRIWSENIFCPEKNVEWEHILE